jgi:hypothetical protein
MESDQIKGTIKQRLWLFHFLDSDGPGFWHRARSAELAGYSNKTDNFLRTVGLRNYRFWAVEIDKWLDEIGLSDTALKGKLVRLLRAKETKFFSKDGFVTEEKEVDALAIQAKALEMALDMKGLRKQVHEHKTDAPILVIHSSGKISEE